MPPCYGDFLAALSAPCQVFTENRLQNLLTSVALLAERPAESALRMPDDPAKQSDESYGGNESDALESNKRKSKAIFCLRQLGMQLTQTYQCPYELGVPHPFVDDYAVSAVWWGPGGR